MLANIIDTAISYSSVDVWIYSVSSSWVLLLNKTFVFIELGLYYAPSLPTLAMTSCRFLCLSSCYCGEVFCCSHRTCIVQIVCYITLGCFFPIRSPISLQSEDLSHGSQLWMCYRKWWGLLTLWQGAERYVILKFLYMSDDTRKSDF